MKQRTFLTAEWNNLLMLNYAVDPMLLRPFVPAGTELEPFQAEFFLSLIGFEFNRTRIAGVVVPRHRSFEEVNLRFYVRRGDRRAVVFIRELVPKRAVAAIARHAFGENYSCVPMTHSIRRNNLSAVIEAEYSWGSAASECTMRIETDGPDYMPAEDSLAQFITEHYWGYAAQSNGASLEYEVQHPRWTVRNAKRAQFEGDASGYYGTAFAGVLERAPDSAFLVGGSPVTVFKGSKIHTRSSPATVTA